MRSCLALFIIGRRPSAARAISPSKPKNLGSDRTRTWRYLSRTSQGRSLLPRIAAHGAAQPGGGFRLTLQGANPFASWQPSGDKKAARGLLTYIGRDKSRWAEPNVPSYPRLAHRGRSIPGLTQGSFYGSKGPPRIRPSSSPLLTRRFLHAFASPSNAPLAITIDDSGGTSSSTRPQRLPAASTNRLSIKPWQAASAALFAEPSGGLDANSSGFNIGPV